MILGVRQDYAKRANAVSIATRRPPAVVARIAAPVMNAKEIMLAYEDYLTNLLTGISGIFVNNLPVSS